MKLKSFCFVLVSLFITLSLLVLNPVPVLAQVVDTTPPVLNSMSFFPATVDTTNGPATFTVTMDITDETGLCTLGCDSYQSYITFYLVTEAFPDRWDGNPSDIIRSADVNYLVGFNKIGDSTYTVEMQLPMGAPQGEWKVYSLMLGDTAVVVPGQYMFTDNHQMMYSFNGYSNPLPDFVKVLSITNSSAPVDGDNDGIIGEADKCPTENATGFDANSDGCIDNIQGLQQVINTALQEGVVVPEIVNSLTSKVAAALNSIDREKYKAAINQLQAFINELNAQRGKKISDEVAELLMQYAQNVITNIQGQ